MSRMQIRAVPLAIAMLTASAAAAAAQTSEPRFTVSAVTRREQTNIDNGEGGINTAGVSVSVRVTRFASVYGEITAASGEVHDSYEGVFTSLAPSGSPIGEFERLGAVLRRDRTWKAGVGSGFGVSLHTPASARAGVKLSIGAAGRAYDLSDTLTVVRLPEEWPPSHPTGAGTTESSRQHGGATLALGVPINVTPRLVIEPEARWLQTFADEDFASLTFGVRTGWRF